MQGSRTRELTRKTFIITLGRISTQFISFFLLPLYTALLSTDEYGTVDLVTTLVQLIVPISSLTIDQGVFRYLLNCKTNKDKEKTISCALFLLIFTSIITILIYMVISSFTSMQYMHWVILIIIATAFSNLFLQISRGLKKTTNYSIGCFICSSSTIVLNVICIACLKMGASGMLFATFSGNAICCLFLFLNLKIGCFVNFSSVDKKTIKNELKYSLPLIPNQLSIWVMNCSDRIIITLFLGTAANGILAVSHKFSAIFLTFFNIFLLAWHEIGATHYFDEDRDQFFSDILKKILSIFSFLCISIIIALPILFNMFVNQTYNEAYYNIPIYLIASLLNVVIGSLGVIYVATKKTAEIAKTTFIAALINIVVNILLVKHIGLYAASISTFVGYLLTLVYRIIDTRKYIKIRLDIKQILGISVLIFISTFVYYLNNKFVSIIILPIFMMLAILFNKETIRVLLEIISKKTGLNKKNLHIITISALVGIIAVGVLFGFKYYSDHPKKIHVVYKNPPYNITPVKRVLFSDFGAENFTCTGITFDSSNYSFWIGDYGALSPNAIPYPRIIEVNNKLTEILNEIKLDFLAGTSGANLQGVAYDTKDNALWIAIGKSIVQINKKGTPLSTIDMNNYSANGICYNDKDNTLWVLCTKDYLLHFSKEGILLNKFRFDYFAQDHICIINGYLYVTVGADYQGVNNYVCKVNPEDGKVIGLYKTEGANSIEGICFVDNKILIANDGFYHSDVIGQSYITEYSFNEFKQKN